MQRRHIPLVLTALALASGAAFAQAGKDVKIAVIASKTGPLEAYAKQTIIVISMASGMGAP